MKNIIFLFISILLLGCVTTKREIITETHTDTLFVSHTDTIREHIHHTDTIKDYKIIQKTDTVREVQTRVITLKESGDTIREVVNNNIYKYVYLKDSSDRYQNKIDSLQKQITQMQNQKETITNDKDKEVAKTKEKTLWKYVSAGISFFLVVAGVYIVWIRIKQ